MTSEPSRKLKLFCFPYAGGSAIVFNNWKRYLAAGIQLIPVELAGRGRRMNEPLYTNFTEAIDDIFEHIKYEIAGSRYALFGHSLGASLAYELGKKIVRCGLSGPEHIFFSGIGAPHLSRSEKKGFSSMTDEEFKKEVMDLGGTPPEFFEHEELLHLFLPLLRNDFVIAECLSDNTEILPFQCNITVFLGKDDDQTPEESDGWRRYTQGLCTIHFLNGGHFFIHNEMELLVTLVNSKLFNDVTFKLTT